MSCYIVKSSIPALIVMLVTLLVEYHHSQSYNIGFDVSQIFILIFDLRLHNNIEGEAALHDTVTTRLQRCTPLSAPHPIINLIIRIIHNTNPQQPLSEVTETVLFDSNQLLIYCFTFLIPRETLSSAPLTALVVRTTLSFVAKA